MIVSSIQSLSTSIKVSINRAFEVELSTPTVSSNRVTAIGDVRITADGDTRIIAGA